MDQTDQMLAIVDLVGRCITGPKLQFQERLEVEKFLEQEENRVRFNQFSPRVRTSGGVHSLECVGLGPNIIITGCHYTEGWFAYHLGIDCKASPGLGLGSKGVALELLKMQLRSDLMFPPPPTVSWSDAELLACFIVRFEISKIQAGLDQIDDLIASRDP